jgi:Family of unknown function (DUF5372)
VFLVVGQTWSEDRVFFVDGDGRQLWLPVGWTDAAEPDAFVTMAAGRSPFRFADLVELRRLIDGLSDWRAVKTIMPGLFGGVRPVRDPAVAAAWSSQRVIRTVLSQPAPQHLPRRRTNVAPPVYGKVHNIFQVDQHRRIEAVAWAGKRSPELITSFKQRYWQPRCY